MADAVKVERTTTWIDKEMVRRAKVTAELEGKGQTAAEVIEEVLGDPLGARYQTAIEQAHAELGGEAGGA